MAAWSCCICSTPRHCAHIWIARQNYKPRPHIALARPLVCTATPHGCHVSSLLLAHVPSDCSGEPCVVPVSCVTTAELSSPGSSMSATKQGLVQERLAGVSHCKTSWFFHFPDMTLELVVSLELSSVFSHLSLRYCWSWADVGLPWYVTEPGLSAAGIDCRIACAAGRRDNSTYL